MPDFREAALRYHREPRPGKLEITATKPLANQRDLSLAYSPGVAAACEEIAADPAMASEYTGRANLVGVVTNGTAVLGLGAIGPLASKPVMEGKAVLFKKFAGINVFDIELDAVGVDAFVEAVAALAPTFGAINLEDIKAPECFEIEARLRERLDIPVFHDDQHGTAITVGAALLNGLRFQEKRLQDVKLVTSGAGAAALACVDFAVDLGLNPDNVTLTDIHGVVYRGRPEEMDERKAIYARDTKDRTLADVIGGADVFLGLSAPRVLTPAMVKTMADKPLILALANPEPEILPELAKQARPDAVVATGRSDYPNQVNNVLCFPFIFRGALDVGATEINRPMEIACVKALADLAFRESSDVVAAAYGGASSSFGADYLIPSPFDPRLIVQLAPAVAHAAMESGVATRPIEDFDAYEQRLNEFVFRSGLLMKPVFSQARTDPSRIVYAEGEDERILRAVQIVIDEGLAKPILIGRPEVIEQRMRRLGLRFRPGDHCEIVNPQDDPRYGEYWRLYHELNERNGITPLDARTVVRTNTTAIAALMVRRAEADAMICGIEGGFQSHLSFIREVIGLREGAHAFASVAAIIMPKGTFFIADTHVTPEPTAEEIVEIAAMTAQEVRRFGIVPSVALLSHSNFGSADSASADKMREAMRLLHRRTPHLQVEGEMQGNLALDPEIRARIFPNSRLSGQANVWIMPNLDAANIAFNLLNTLGDGQAVGPLLIGAARPAYILNRATTSRGVVNISAFATVAAHHLRAETALAAD